MPPAPPSRLGLGLELKRRQQVGGESVRQSCVWKEVLYLLMVWTRRCIQRLNRVGPWGTPQATGSVPQTGMLTSSRREEANQISRRFYLFVVVVVVESLNPTLWNLREVQMVGGLRCRPHLELVHLCVQCEFGSEVWGDHSRCEDDVFIDPC